MIRADLHVHTYYSDGMQSPQDVIAAAVKRGLGLVAVTDHDTMLAHAEVARLAKEAGIYAVDGIEISAYSSVKVHVLGYGLDCDSRRFREYYRSAVEGAEARCRDILSKLKRHGFNLTVEEVTRERKCPQSPIHTMYIARAAARKGYAPSPADFYLSYLSAGKCGYSAVGRISPFDAVRVIHDCGGIASLAHPARIALGADQREALIADLANCGLDGIEAVYSGHTDRETAHFKEIAAKYGLLVTGGSDTHYTEGNRQVGVPGFYPDDALLSALNIK